MQDSSCSSLAFGIPSIGSPTPARRKYELPEDLYQEYGSMLHVHVLVHMHIRVTYANTDAHSHAPAPTQTHTHAHTRTYALKSTSKSTSTTECLHPHLLLRVSIYRSINPSIYLCICLFVSYSSTCLSIMSQCLSVYVNTIQYIHACMHPNSSGRPSRARLARGCGACGATWTLEAGSGQNEKQGRNDSSLEHQ